MRSSQRLRFPFLLCGFFSYRAPILNDRSRPDRTRQQRHRDPAPRVLHQEHLRLRRAGHYGEHRLRIIHRRFRRRGLRIEIMSTTVPRGRPYYRRRAFYDEKMDSSVSRRIDRERRNRHNSSNSRMTLRPGYGPRTRISLEDFGSLRNPPHLDLESHRESTRRDHRKREKFLLPSLPPHLALNRRRRCPLQPDR